MGVHVNNKKGAMTVTGKSSLACYANAEEGADGAKSAKPQMDANMHESLNWPHLC